MSTCPFDLVSFFIESDTVSSLKVLRVLKLLKLLKLLRVLKSMTIFKRIQTRCCSGTGSTAASAESPQNMLHSHWEWEGMGGQH